MDQDSARHPRHHRSTRRDDDSAVAPIAKNYLEKHSKELVGRQITIEKLRFNVLNGKLRIDRIAMLEPDDSTTFASLGNFYTRIHLLPLLRQRIHIDAVLIDKPYLNVYQDGTSFNFDDLLNRFLTLRTQSKRPRRTPGQSISTTSRYTTAS